MPLALNTENPRWKSLYEMAVEVPIGTLLTYESMQEATGCDIRGESRGLVYATNKRLLREHRRMLRNVREIGYEVALPLLQVAHGANRRVRAKRQLDKGVLELTHVDTTQMSPSEKIRLTHLVNHMSSLQAEVRKGMSKSIASTEQALNEQKESASRLDEIEAQLNAIMKRLAE